MTEVYVVQWLDWECSEYESEYSDPHPGSIAGQKCYFNFELAKLECDRINLEGTKDLLQVEELQCYFYQYRSIEIWKKWAARFFPEMEPDDPFDDEVLQGISSQINSGEITDDHIKELMSELNLDFVEIQTLTADDQDVVP